MLADRPRKYLRLAVEDDYVATQMDGTRTVSDLVVGYFHRFGRFAFDRIASLVHEFRQAKLLTDPPHDIYKELGAQLHPKPEAKPRRWEGTPLRMRLPLRGIDGFVTRYHDRVGWIFYTRPALLLGAAVTVVGLAAFVTELRRGRDPFAPLGTSHLLGLVALVVGYYAAIFVHESAHALTAKHFGSRVDQGGFMLYYMVPAFYVNVTDSWLVPWYRRIAISWAGPYSGFILGGLGSIVVFLFPGNGLFTTLVFKLVVVAYINNVFNLLPLLLLDGYWILEEWMETPRLRDRALAFVRGPLWIQLLDRRAFSRREVFYAIFGGLCAVYSFLAVYLAFLYWGRRLKPIVRPLWLTPGFLSKAVLVVVVTAVAIPLGIRFGTVLLTYLKVIRTAPAAAKRALAAIRTRDRLRLLESLAFLGTLPIASIERLAHAARVRQVPAGVAVVRQGERGNEFYILAQGEAEVTVREQGDDRVTANLKAGDFFGEGALLGTGVRGATVRALTPLVLLVIGQRPFWAELAGAVGWQARVRAALEERQRLQQVPLFRDTSPRQLDLLAVRLAVQPTQAGAVLVQQGDPGDAFFLVREGQFSVETAGKHINTLGPGEFFGEIALLHNVPRTATVRALTDGSVWRLEGHDFRDLLGRYLNLEGEIAAVAGSRVPRGHEMQGAA
jgi:putative peptide zinc metalloprotease protein